jgi:ribosomal protein S27E
MRIENQPYETGRGPTVESTRMKLRSRGDRCCPNCSKVALVFDTDAGTARCRVCGRLD